MAGLIVSFDHLAPHYRWMEAVTAGPLLQRARTTWLDAIEGRQQVLCAGEGPGRFLDALVSRHPSVAATYLDASPGMARVAQRRVHGSSGEVHWLQVDVTTWDPPPRVFDVIATHFMLDCFAPSTLRSVVHRLAAAATHDAIWLVTDFAVPPRGLLRWRAQAMLAVMYASFRATTGIDASVLTEPDEYLQLEGFRLAGRRTSSLGLIRADLWRRS